LSGKCKIQTRAFQEREPARALPEIVSRGLDVSAWGKQLECGGSLGRDGLY
jgi:hypothetical protein